MRQNMIFSNAKKNPYAKKLKSRLQSIWIFPIDYFKDKAETSGIPLPDL